MSEYNIDADPRMKPKVAKVSTGKECLVYSCQECPHYQSNPLKNWEYCHNASKEIQLRIGQDFPGWCPLPVFENVAA